MQLEQPAQVYQRLQKRFSRKAAHKRLVRYGLLAVNIVIVMAAIGFVVRNPESTAAIDRAVGSAADNSSGAADPLDQLSSADIAVNVARLDDLPETTAIINQADSENAQLAVVQTAASLVAKPQVVATAFKSNRDIQVYIAHSGDSIASVASKFNITSDSVRWSNNLTGDAVTPGQKLLIPPVNGIVYVVKSGDTAAGLAQQYHTTKDKIIAYNDAEISGLHVGERIIIPGGQVQSVVNPTYAGSYGLASSWGISAIYGYNGYDYGYCTWWVANRRIQVGEALPSNLGNASTWPYLARLYGLSVGYAPKRNAAVVTSTYGEGHVAFVESVNGDGSITVSEMNHLGWGVEDTRTFSAAEAAGFIYIY